MWKAAVGHNVTVTENTGNDDWETDPDFVNDISEEEQRWGAKTIEGSGRPQHIDINKLRSNVSKEHEQLKKKELKDSPKASYGYGGQFGTEKDRMDKSALGHDYKADVEKHSSQTDAAKGFGGKYGVQRERCDKSAVGFDYKAQIQQHSSQQDHSKGFGGRYGVQTDRVDKSALGFEYKAQVQQHSSQQDYSQGFGGKFGVQKDRQDKAAHSWSHKEDIEKHQSQTDYAKGFGGRYGVQTDRVDKSAAGFGEIELPSSAYEKTQPLEAMTSGAQSLRSRFENMAKAAEEENCQKAEEERARRQNREKMERQENLQKKTTQISRIDEPKKEPIPVPVPTPRGLQASPQLTMEDPEPDTPPAVPPKLPELTMTTESTQNKMWNEEQTYEDIPTKSHAVEDLYEAIPDPPPRLLEDDNEEYETILEPAGTSYEDIYEDMPKEDELHEQGLKKRQKIDLGSLGDQGTLVVIKETDLGVKYIFNSGSAQIVQGPSTNINQAGASGISAVALYDYEGGGDDEISFEPQDLITDIEMLDEGWWTGSCRGLRGLFPANYVELL